MRKKLLQQRRCAPCIWHTYRRKAATFLLLCALMLSVTLSFAQTKVTGSVTDEKNELLTGVSVKIKGTSTGVVTDINGKFSVNLNAAATLVFTYVGFNSKEVVANPGDVLNVSMNATANNLSEVVVVGYGKQRKEAITGAIANVTSEDLDRVKAISAANSLAGKLAGLSFRMPDGTPGADARIQIRNMGTPLYVIDGIQKDEGQFNNIAPNDIESITILKDASASVYGSRAANGVVVVTTKRGKAGRKPTITVDSYYGMQSWTRFPKLANAYEWRLGEVDATVNTNINGVNSGVSKDELEKYRLGTDLAHQSFDWYKFIVRSYAPQTSLNANVSGGSQDVKYYLSVTNLYQEAVYGKNFTFKRTNLQANIDANITNSLKVGIQMNGRIENNYNPNLPGGNAYGAAVNALTTNVPWQRPYANDNPEYLAVMRNNDTNFGFLNDVNKSGERDVNWRIFSPTFNAEYNLPLKGLTVRGVYSYYLADNVVENFEKVNYSMYTYDEANNKYNVAVTRFQPYRNRETKKVIEEQYRGELAYTNTFGKHKIDFLALAERVKRFEQFNNLVASPKLTVLDPILFPDLQQTNFNDGYFKSNRIGYVARINYNYASKYYLEAAIRRDASTIFAPDKRWGNFPSVSVGWRITEENFFKSLKVDNVLSDLKFRASYGILGDDNIGLANFFYLNSYQYPISTVALDGVAYSSSKYNGPPTTDIGWYERQSLNIGADFGLFNNRLTGSVEYFRAKLSGLRAIRNDVVLPSELGYAIPQENLNSDLNTGYEISLNYKNSIGKLSYRVGGNFSYARRKTDFRYNEQFGNSYDRYRNGQSNRWDPRLFGYQVEGQFQSYEQIRNYPVDIDGQGNVTLLPGDLIYKDVNGDKRIDGLDERPLGWPSNGAFQPIMNFGLSIGLAYKGVDLSADFSGASGYSYIANFENRWAYQSGNALLSRFLEDRWHRADPYDPNSEWIPGKNLPLRFNAGGHSNYNKVSDYWMTNVNYLRPRTIELGYTLPASLLQKMKIQRLRLYVNTYNLFSIDNLKKYEVDPEIIGENGRVYPQSRLINFGINLSL